MESPTNPPNPLPLEPGLMVLKEIMGTRFFVAHLSLEVSNLHIF